MLSTWSYVRQQQQLELLQQWAYTGQRETANTYGSKAMGAWKVLQDQVYWETTKGILEDQLAVLRLQEENGLKTWPADTPVQPSGPNKTRLIAIGLSLAFIFSLLFVVFVDLLKRFYLKKNDKQRENVG